MSDQPVGLRLEQEGLGERDRTADVDHLAFRDEHRARVDRPEEGQGELGGRIWGGRRELAVDRAAERYVGEDGQGSASDETG